MQDQEILAKIEAMNLESIIYSLVKAPEGLRWQEKRARTAEKWYRRYLFLVVRYPQEAVVPTKEIDEVWHAHILDTRKYFQDCEEIFGDYLHHFPYLGTRGDADKQDLEVAFLRTLALFELHFNEMPTGAASDAQSAICSKCSRCTSLFADRVPTIDGRAVDLATRPSMNA